MWISNKKQQPQYRYVKPNDPWFVNVDDLSLDHMMKCCNDVTIYDATWRRFQRVCVKRVCVTTNNNSLIKRELEILSMCAHPSVCQFLGIAQDIGYVYFIFEYMDNGNLEEYVCHNRLTNLQKIDILLDVARGLHYLSSRQPLRIIHRDFKPTNILVNKHGEAKISDFGISKLFKHSDPLLMYDLSLSTVSSGVVGTVRWTAPEVLCDNRYNHLCDIFAFGLVAYFVWTDGDLPYHHEYKNHGAKITFAKMHNERPFLFRVQDTGMHALIKDCTEKNINLRPPNAQSLVERLLQIKKYSHCE